MKHPFIPSKDFIKQAITYNRAWKALSKAPDERYPLKKIKRLWNCRSKADQDCLEKLTIDAVNANRAALGFPDLGPEFARILDKLAQDNPDANAREAIKTDDEKRLCELLAAHPEVGPFMIHELMREIHELKQPKPGRKKGDPRPNDLPEAVRDALPEACIYVMLIREIWWRLFGKRNRTAAPTAIQIAVKVFKDTGMTETNLRGYLKNYHRNFAS